MGECYFCGDPLEEADRARPFIRFRDAGMHYLCIARLHGMLVRAEGVVAHKKPSWSLPDPPTCPNCGGQAHAAVHNTGDGWTWG